MVGGIKIFTMASDPNHLGIRQFVSSAEYWGWDYDIFMFDPKTKSKHGVAQFKMALLEHVLRTIEHDNNDYTYVGIIDGYDMVFNNTPDMCIRRMEANVRIHPDSTLITGYSTPKFLNLISMHKPVVFFNKYINKTDENTFSTSNDCGDIPINLGMVMGGTLVIQNYARAMLSCWYKNESMCSQKVCSEQKYFKLLMDEGTYACKNKTLFIDVDNVFVHNHLIDYDRMTKRIFNNAIVEECDIERPIFHHFPGNSNYPRGVMLQTHYYNNSVNLPCDTYACPICSYNKTFEKLKIIFNVMLCATIIMLFLKKNITI